IPLSTAEAVPVFPSRPVMEHGTRKSKVVTHRSQILDEIVNSEETYVKELRVLVGCILRPLAAWREATTVPFEPDDIAKVFGNVEQLLRFNEQFLRDLQAEHRGRKRIGGVFTEAAARFGLYSSYINNYDDAMLRLKELEANPEFRAFVRACELQEPCHGLDVRSFLIQPVQRVPRYKLLLSELLKHTRDTHPDFGNLRTGLEGVARAASLLNENARDHGRRKRVLELQLQFKESFATPSRYLVKEGELKKVCNSGPKRYKFVLFNDMLLYGTETLRGMLLDKTTRKYKAHKRIPLDRMLVLDYDSATGFVVACPGGKSFVAAASTPREKQEWLDAFTECFTAVRAKATEAAEAAAAAISGCEGAGTGAEDGSGGGGGAAVGTMWNSQSGGGDAFGEMSYESATTSMHRFDIFTLAAVPRPSGSAAAGAADDGAADGSGKGANGNGHGGSGGGGGSSDPMRASLAGLRDDSMQRAADFSPPRRSPTSPTGHPAGGCATIDPGHFASNGGGGGGNGGGNGGGVGAGTPPRPLLRRRSSADLASYNCVQVWVSSDGRTEAVEISLQGLPNGTRYGVYVVSSDALEHRSRANASSVGGGSGIGGGGTTVGSAGGGGGGGGGEGSPLHAIHRRNSTERHFGVSQPRGAGAAVEADDSLSPSPTHRRFGTVAATPGGTGGTPGTAGGSRRASTGASGG
ncbi:unnamed protein product, partial [Phaeothamnion confervicola]